MAGQLIHPVPIGLRQLNPFPPGPQIAIGARVNLLPLLIQQNDPLPLAGGADGHNLGRIDACFGYGLLSCLPQYSPEKIGIEFKSPGLGVRWLLIRPFMVD